MTKEIPTFLDAKTEQFTVEEAETFVKLCLATGQTVENPFVKEYLQSLNEMPYSTLPFQVKIFKGRIEHIGLKLQTSLALLILILCKSPGDIVLWCWTLAHMVPEKGELLTIDDWTKAFPAGPPTEDEKSRVWLAQKSDTGQNLLDLHETWKAFCK